MIDFESVITTISLKIIAKLHLKMVRNKKRVIVINADGLRNKGGWKYNVEAIVNTAVSTRSMNIAVLQTNKDRFLLGNDWIKAHEVIINDENQTIHANDKKTDWLSTQPALREITNMTRHQKKERKHHVTPQL